MMGDCGAIQLILCALKKHKDEGRVVKNACMALATIVEADGKWIPFFTNCVNYSTSRFVSHIFFIHFFF